MLSRSGNNGNNLYDNAMIKFSKPERGRPKQPPKLSDYQKRVILLLAEGNSMKMIAAITGKTFFSVNSALNCMLHKYQVYTKISLIIKLHQSGEININEIQIINKFKNAA